MDLLTRPATEILAALGRREVSAVELADAALARIAALNPALNAVVAQDAEAARAAARASDARRAKGLDGLLEGLPMTIKDAYDVAGLPSTAGAPSWKDRVPEADAVPVARLRAAGAVILGKSNVPPWSGDWIAENPLYGRTNSPWDPARSPGGSSGGAVVAVSTGMSALELGSDLGGSIRWPAHATGLFGLKPTWGLVSMRGHRPPPPGVDVEGDLAVAGPLARSARDLDLMLSVIAGPPALDGVRPVIDPPRRTGPKGLRVGLWASDPFAPADAAVVAGVRRAADLLAAAGAIVDDAARPAFTFAESFEVYALLNTPSSPSACRKKFAPCWPRRRRHTRPTTYPTARSRPAPRRWTSPSTAAFRTGARPSSAPGPPSSSASTSCSRAARAGDRDPAPDDGRSPRPPPRRRWRRAALLRHAALVRPRHCRAPARRRRARHADAGRPADGRPGHRRRGSRPHGHRGRGNAGGGGLRLPPPARARLRPSSPEPQPRGSIGVVPRSPSRSSMKRAPREGPPRRAASPPPAAPPAFRPA